MVNHRVIHQRSRKLTRKPFATAEILLIETTSLTSAFQGYP